MLCPFKERNLLRIRDRYNNATDGGTEALESKMATMGDNKGSVGHELSACPDGDSLTWQYTNNMGGFLLRGLAALWEMIP